MTDTDATTPDADASTVGRGAGTDTHTAEIDGEHRSDVNAASSTPAAPPVDATPVEDGPLDDEAAAAGKVGAVDAPKLTRRGRLRKWDRPPPPRDWRWAVSHLGRVLITVGLLMFGFVAYQLWGTAIENAQAQNALENDFEELLATVEPVGVDDPTDAVDDPTDADAATGTGTGTDVDPDADTDTADGSTADDGRAPVTSAAPADDTGTDPSLDTDTVAVEEPVTTAAPADEPVAIPVSEQNIPLVEEGDALARIEIPRIGLNDIVVAGVETSDLKRGPGHFPDTPLPGQLGNSAIAGHRTTYGQPFHDVDKLEPGDEIRVTTLSGVFVYRVTGQQIVSPSDYQVVATTDPTVANLTLTSCHPKWTAQQRIVIFSELDDEASSRVGEPIYNYGREADEPDTDETAAELPADDFDETTVDGADEPVDGSTTDEAPQAPDTGDIDEADEGDDADDAAAVADASGDAGSQAPAATSAGIADAFAEGWFSDPGANLQVGMWGLVLAAIAIAAYLISRRLRRDWVGAMVGVVPFVVALYFFFQNVNRLLPPNL